MGQPQHSGQAGAARAGAHADPVVSALQDPGGSLLAVGGHLPGLEGERDLLAAAGSDQVGLGKADQLLLRFGQFALGRGGIELHDFLAGHDPGVAHGGLNRYGLAVQPDLSGGDLEGRIGPAEAEGIGRLDPEGVEVAVAHIDPVGIVFVVDVAVVVAVVGGGGVVGVVLRPGVGEFAGGIDLAGKHVSEHLSADVAQLSHENDRVDALHGQDLAHVDHAAQIQHQHQLFVEAGQKSELLELGVVEQIIAPLVPAVGAFARGAGDHIYGEISLGAAQILLGDLDGRDDLEGV